MSSGNKGQATLEFLTSYGWALLIIVIVGAVIFFIVDPFSLTGDTKTGFSGIDVANWGVDSSNDDLLLQLENRKAQKVNVTAIYVESLTSGTVQKTNKSIALNPGERRNAFDNADLPDSVNSGDGYRYDVFVEYYYTDVGSSQKFNSTGRVSGRAS